MKSTQVGLDKVSKRITRRLQEVKENVLFLSTTPPIKGILRAFDHKGIDSRDHATLKQWRNRLETIFREMLYVKKNYLQIRYIGINDGGREIVRVDRDSSKVKVVPFSELQKKGDEDYFKETFKLSSSKVYLSPFNFNREHGVIQYPLTAVMRAAIPIYRKASDPFGMVIINVNYSSILKNREWDRSEGRGELYIVDDEDKLLLDSYSSETEDHALKSVPKSVKDIIFKSKETKRNIIKVGHYKWLVRKIHYNKLDPKKYLIFLAKYDEDALVSKAQYKMFSSILLLFFVTALALGFAFFFSGHISRKLKKLMAMTQDILDGQVDEVLAKNSELINSEIDRNSLTEIDLLTHTIINMANSMIVVNRRLEGQTSALDHCAIVSETSIDGVITYVNDNFIHLSKYPRSEIIGKKHDFFKSGHHAPSFFHDMWHTILQGHLWSGEVCNRAADETLYWIKLTIYPAKNQKGEIDRFISIGFDVTERVNAESKLTLVNREITSQKEALDSAAIVAETDLRGRIIYVNQKLVSISGYSEGELFGRDHRILNSGHHSKEFFSILWETILSGRVWTGEICNKAKNGELYWTDTTIYPYKGENSEISKFIAIRFDITQKKKTEVNLQKASKKAMAALDAKQSFLANMSHEIRTPLNGIIGFSTLLLDQKLSHDNLEQVHYIKDCSEGLLSIINDVLDFSKIEAGKFKIEEVEFDLHQVISSALSVFHVAIKDKNIDLEVKVDEQIPHALRGDPLRIRQIILNLVSNAIKFTDVNGRIIFDVHPANEDSKQNISLNFSVKDNGVGIPDDRKEFLFHSFEQADNSIARKHGGTGLGLSICKNLIELMGGTIGFKSQKGVGTTFFFELSLPVSSDSSVGQEQVRTALCGGERTINPELRILVAEDNITNQKLITSILRKFKCEQVTVVENGELAVAALSEQSFDLVFMDIQMPIMNGYDATKVIRTQLNLDVLIYGLSANAFSEDQSKALELGMDGYIEKPIKISALRELLKQVSAMVAKDQSVA